MKCYNAGWGDEELKKFKLTLLDASNAFHISESTLIISYEFR
jgi:hypothetical protein